MRIRNIAICLISHGEKIFVAEGRDEIENQIFYRPLGGGIEFGELASEAAVREFNEEIGTEIEVLAQLHVFENIFTFDGKAGHEIVFLLSAEFKDLSLYERDNIVCNEQGVKFVAKWVDKSDFLEGRKVLYPRGLSEYLTDSYKTK